MASSKNGVFLVLLAICLTSQAALIEYDWANHNTKGATYNWGDPTVWVGGVVPTATDDVSIIGCAACSLGLVGVSNYLSIPNGAAVNSLQFKAGDMMLLVQGSLTIGNFSFEGGSIQGTSTSESVISTTGISTFSYRTADVCQFSSLTLLNTGSLTWTTLSSCNFTHVNGTNAAGSTWDWKLAELQNGIFGSRVTRSVLGNSFNNFGTMSIGILPGNTKSASVIFQAQFVNSGSIYVNDSSVFHLSNGGMTDLVTLENYGLISVSSTASFVTAPNTAINFRQGSVLSGTGEITADLVGTNANCVITQYTDLTFGGTVLIDGGVVFAGNDYTFTTQTFLMNAQTTITGTKPLRTNIFNIRYSDNVGRTQINRDVIISNSAYFGAYAGFETIYVNNGAKVQIENTAVATFGKTFWNTTDTGSIVVMGTLKPETEFAGSSDFYLPVHVNANGNITIPAYKVSNTPNGCELRFFGGGDLKGGIFSPSTTTLGRTTQEKTTLMLGRNKVSTSTITGVFTVKTGYDGCNTMRDVACRNLGPSFVAPINIPAIALTRYGSIIVDSANVLVENFVTTGGAISGSADKLTVKNFIPDSFRGDLNPLYIDGIDVNVDTTAKLDGTYIHFQNGARLIIESTATVTVSEDIEQPTSSGADNGYILNHGTVKLTPSSTEINKNFTNDGQIQFTTTPGTLTISGEAGSVFSQTANGVININVYSKTSTDSIVYTSTTGCAFSGKLNINFKYTPSVDDKIAVIKYDDDKPCTGLFTVSVTGLGINQNANLYYDLKDSSSTWQYFGYIVVCRDTNSTCKNYKRDPAATTSDATTTTTTLFMLLTIFLCCLTIFF